MEKMEEVLQMLLNLHPNARVFLFGSGIRERKCFEEWTKRFPRCVHVSSALNNLGDELILMSHLDVMVSMDSANAHLAAITGVPVVSIWGGTHPFAGFMAWNQSVKTAVQLDMTCRPCSIFGNKPCVRGDMACMNGISPNMVVERVEKVLECN